MGATVTVFRKAIAESRVRINTGRFLSGALEVYQQTCPWQAAAGTSSPNSLHTYAGTASLVRVVLQL